jgi:CheY-like chemotaxis protein
MQDLEGLKHVHSMSAPPLRVLVVENDQQDAELIATVIQRNGAEPQIAGSAEEAIHMIKLAIPFAAAFIDLSLPGGRSGIAVAAALRRMWPETQIIIVSGHLNDSIIRECERFGLRVYQKPVDSLTISAMLKPVIGPQI